MTRLIAGNRRNGGLELRRIALFRSQWRCCPI